MGLEDLVMKKDFAIDGSGFALDVKDGHFTGRDVKLLYKDTFLELVSALYFSTDFLKEQANKSMDLKQAGMTEITLTPRVFKDGDTLNSNELLLTHIHRDCYGLRVSKCEGFPAYCRLTAGPGESRAWRGYLEFGLNEKEFQELSKVSFKSDIAVGVSMRLYEGTQADLK